MVTAALGVFGQGDLEKTAEIEGCVIDCLLVMVMKLSEVTFRPLFFKVCESATSWLSILLH